MQIPLYDMVHYMLAFFLIGSFTVSVCLVSKELAAILVAVLFAETVICMIVQWFREKRFDEAKLVLFLIPFVLMIFSVMA